jgi:hypothetical protein
LQNHATIYLVAAAKRKSIKNYSAKRVGFSLAPFSVRILSKMQNRIKRQNMEKNQHNSNAATTNDQNNSGLTGNQPGQQLPAGHQAEDLDTPNVPEEKVRHSESSFPKQNGETLGTP